MISVGLLDSKVFYLNMNTKKPTYMKLTDVLLPSRNVPILTTSINAKPMVKSQILKTLKSRSRNLGKNLKYLNEDGRSGTMS